MTRVTRRAGGLLWGLLVLTILVEVPVALAWEPAYDPIELTVSDLGATTCTVLDYPGGPVAVCSPWHALMNVVTILGGLALTAGGLLLRRLAQAGWRRMGFVLLIVLSGASWVAAGLVPVDRDLALHTVVALPAFIAQSVALLLVRREPGGPAGSWARAAAWVGALGLVATATLMLAQAIGLPLGLIERIALYPVVIWYAVAGWRIVGSARAPNR